MLLTSTKLNPKIVQNTNYINKGIEKETHSVCKVTFYTNYKEFFHKRS